MVSIEPNSKSIPGGAGKDLSPLEDRFGRHIRYLRVSLTEHCNFRCEYCTPANGTPYFERADHLQGDELQRLLGIFARMGLQHLRLTGGEPLIHPRVVDHVAHAQALNIGKISISSNGYLLDRLAAPLAAAGLNNLNVSLDTLDAQSFAQVTRGGDLRRVLRGIDAAQRAGIARIKLNAVLLRRINGHALPELVRFALERGLELRFIETMPLGAAGSTSQDSDYLSAQDAQRILEAEFGSLLPVASSRDGGPARRYAVPGYGTHLGFITPISENFCATCNRVRLTATGRLVYCLGHEAGMDLLPLLRNADIDDDAISAAIRQGIWTHKPERHDFLEDRLQSSKIFMMRLGG